jgi:hypothetical protein
MGDSQVALAKRDEKRRLEKQASTAIYLNLTKKIIDV